MQQRAREILLPESRFPPPLKVAAVEVLRDDGGPDSIRRLIATAGHELGEVQDFALKSLLVMDRGAVLLLVIPMLSPDATPGRSAACCASVPNFAIGSAPSTTVA